MKHLCALLLSVCLLLVLAACSDSSDYEEPVGGDWHVWGMYEFVSVGETKVAIGRAYGEGERLIGYDIYADGESQGPLLGELRLPAAYTDAEIDADAFLLFEDFTGEGTVDIGMPVKGGDIVWFAQEKGEDGTAFPFAEVQKADDAG